MLINGKRAALRCGVDSKTFYRWVKAGVIPVFVDPVTGTKRYSEESIDAWLASFKPLRKEAS